jgi:hypothetical protein
VVQGTADAQPADLPCRAMIGTIVCPTSGVHPRGPERGEGLVWCNDKLDRRGDKANKGVAVHRAPGSASVLNGTVAMSTTARDQSITMLERGAGLPQVGGNSEVPGFGELLNGSIRDRMGCRPDTSAIALQCSVVKEKFLARFEKMSGPLQSYRASTRPRR